MMQETDGQSTAIFSDGQRCDMKAPDEQDSIVLRAYFFWRTEISDLAKFLQRALNFRRVGDLDLSSRYRFSA